MNFWWWAHWQTREGTIIGTSLNVFPAASLIDYATRSERIILIDPNASYDDGIEVISEKATKAVPKLVEELLELLDWLSVQKVN